ncbi:MAG: HNH endonuclease [Magnetococcus sp. MYC-9]
MIHVKKSYDTVPAGLTGSTADTWREKLMREGNAHTAENRVHAHASVKAALGELYHNKCAYCESYIVAQADRRVDHHRPKKARIEEGDPHPGYFWLTYEWSNLVLACDTCNGKKSNKFPIAGIRVAAPPPSREDWHPRSATMSDEQPLLLNPEVDNPADHLVFSPDGQISAKGDDQRGRVTIKVCELDREQLTLARKEKVDKLRSRLNRQLLRFIENDSNWLVFQEIIEDIKASGQPESPFSLLGQHINGDPDEFLLAKLSTTFWGTVHTALERFPAPAPAIPPPPLLTG